ncbi:hypothetical protein BgiBS90_018360, partial [Biomphalaria glabrata]
ELPVAIPMTPMQPGMPDNSPSSNMPQFGSHTCRTEAGVSIYLHAKQRSDVCL